MKKTTSTAGTKVGSILVLFVLVFSLFVFSDNTQIAKADLTVESSPSPAPEESPTPEASLAPEESSAPDPTIDPSLSSAPEVSPTPEISPSPDASLAPEEALPLGASMFSISLPVSRFAEILSPSDRQVVVGVASFDAALQNDPSGDDAVQWAIRKDTCEAGTGTVFGNVDGHSDLYDWNSSSFHAETDTSAWEDGAYCFVFNPTESAGDAEIRETREFVVDNNAPIVSIESPLEGEAVSGIVHIFGTIQEDIEMGNYNIAIYPGDADFMDFSKRLEQNNVDPATAFTNQDIYQWDTTGYESGEYLIRLAARDNAGNRDLSKDPYAGGDDSQHVVRVTIGASPSPSPTPNLPPSPSPTVEPSPTPEDSDEWWNTDYAKRIKITFDTTQTAPDEDLIDFPAVVQINNSLVSYSDIQDQGQDIRFVDSDNATPLPYEIEQWNELGTSVIWTKVPQIDHNTNTDHIWMYYKNAEAQDASNPMGVWNDNYFGVWHFAQDPTGSADDIFDSTANANHMSSQNMDSGNRTTGKLGYALSFNGTDEYLNRASALIGTPPYTLQAWAKTSLPVEISRYMVAVGDTATNNYETAVMLTSLDPAGRVGALTRGTSPTAGAYTASQVSTDAWFLAHGAFAGAADRQVYLNGGNGVQETTSKTYSGYDTTRIGARARLSGGEYFSGAIDEARITGTALHAQWIAFEYCNMAGGCETYSDSEENPDLIIEISDEEISEITENSITVSWITNKPATSRVVYDTISHESVLLSDPNYYGYANTTDEDGALVTEHSVTIGGLSAGTTYFFRPVSHGSPQVIGEEISATTEDEIIDPAPDDSWWNDAYEKRVKIVFDTTQAAPNEDLIDFPAVVQINNSLVSYSDIQDQGQDIRFVDSDNTTVLNYEIEEWNELGTSLVWVKVPQIDHSSNTDHIWMYYKNAEAQDASNPADVWNSQYVMVQHLQETDIDGGEGDIKDSTANAHDGTTVNMENEDQQNGMLDGSFNFDGDVSDEIIEIPDADDLDGMSGLSVSAWFKMDELVPHDIIEQYIISKHHETSVKRTWILGVEADLDDNKHEGRMWFGLGVGGNTMNYLSSVTLPAADQWYYGVGTYDGSTRSIYINGAWENSDSKSGDVNSNDNPVAIGARKKEAYESFWNGLVDEVRISNVARSSEWIAFEYCNIMGECAEYIESEQNPSQSPSLSPSPTPEQSAENTEVIVESGVRPPSSRGGGLVTSPSPLASPSFSPNLAGIFGQFAQQGGEQTGGTQTTENEQPTPSPVIEEGGLETTNQNGGEQANILGTASEENEGQSLVANILSIFGGKNIWYILLILVVLGLGYFAYSKSKGNN